MKEITLEGMATLPLSALTTPCVHIDVPALVFTCFGRSACVAAQGWHLGIKERAVVQVLFSLRPKCVVLPACPVLSGNSLMWWLCTRQV